MAEWFRNTKWNDEIADLFELKLKRARGDRNKAQYLQIQATHLIDSDKFGSVGDMLLLKLFRDFPQETFSVIFGHEQLGDYYFKIGQIDKAEREYQIVVDYYHSNTRSGTSGIADIKLANLILTYDKKDKFKYAYNLITKDFIDSNGELGLNDSRYFYTITCARLSWKLGLKEDARDFAKIALDLSNIKEPQFSRHKTVGLVKTTKEEIEELENIMKN